MNAVKVPLKHSPYLVYIGSDVIEKTGRLLRAHFNGDKIALFTHRRVFALHGKKIMSSLKKAELHAECVFVPAGETSKSLAQLAVCYDRLAAMKFQRDSAVLALGGGVIGDLAGFCAATYMRGVALFHMPTTVVAQSDSSIGGKTGVNHPSAKNLIGAFYQPRGVFCDVRCLRTLPQREYVSGLAEVVKYGMIADASFLTFLERNAASILERDEKVLVTTIKRCVEIKACVTGRDEKEKNLRMILNYGHTIGHALETSSDYALLLHGEAVARGMVFAARLSRFHGNFPQKAEERQNALLKRFSLLKPLKNPADMNGFLRLLSLDKKAVKGKNRFVLLRAAGKAYVTDKVSSALIKKVAAETLWNDSV